MKEKVCEQIDEVLGSFREIWKFDKLLFVVLLVNVVIHALQPFPEIILSGMMIDSITKGEFHNFIIYMCLMFGINSILATIGIWLGKIKEYLFLKFIDKMNNDMSKKCLNMDYEQFNDSNFQDNILLISQMMYGNNYFTNISNVFETLSQVIALVGIVIIMTMLNNWLLLIAFVIILLQSVLHIIRQKYDRQFQMNTVSNQRKLQYMSLIPRNIHAKKDVDIFNLSNYVFGKIELFQKSMLKSNANRIKKAGIIETITYLLSVVFQISAYILIGINAYRGIISVGEFTMGVASLINFMTASSFVATNILDFGNGISYINKYRNFLNFKSRFDDTTGLTLEDLDLDHIEIEFKNISFRYPNSTSYVLKNINLKICDREKLAVVGYNGAGKTTLTLLLMRMYEPTEGEILLNGVDIRKINFREYLKIFSTVNQDFFLFPFSIKENIDAGGGLLDQERLKELCREYGLEERIKKMYKGFDTPITKELFAAGVDLSGGERQKIAILRALFKESSILILDEPTAALDPVAESEIYHTFNDISDGKLTVYISHRINSTRFCDKIVVLEKGEMLEYGSYDELMEKKGIYYRFFQMQAELYK